MTAIVIYNLPLPDLTGVTSLTISDRVRGSINNLDFKSVKHLILGNQLPGSIVDGTVYTADQLNLKGLTHLTFGYHFNQPVDKLDLKDITHLSFGHCFNHPVDKLDLKSVTHLSFGHSFNQPLDNLNLKNVTHLSFSNHPINNIDLKGVTHLSFGPDFNGSLEHLDLSKITHLTIANPKYSAIIANLNIAHINITSQHEVCSRFDAQIRYNKDSCEIQKLKKQIQNLDGSN